MISWLTGLSLRLKLVGLAVGGVLISLAYLYGRWRIAAARAASATQKADSLQAAHDLELRIAERRAELMGEQRKAREQLAERAARDAFEDQGWGP